MFDVDSLSADQRLRCHGFKISGPFSFFWAVSWFGKIINGGLARQDLHSRYHTKKNYEFLLQILLHLHGSGVQSTRIRHYGGYGAYH